MKPKDFLFEAQTQVASHHIDRDRGAERSMARAVRIFNAIKGTELTEDDGWTFMLALKLARDEIAHSKGQFNKDNPVDLIGYAALRAEHRHKAVFGDALPVELTEALTP